MPIQDYHDEIQLGDTMHIGQEILKPRTGNWYFTVCGIALPWSLAKRIHNVNPAINCRYCREQLEWDKNHRTDH